MKPFINEKNVILITIDCLRADHLIPYGYNRNTTPFINKIASDSLLYQNAYSNGPFTPSSFISLLSSRYPLEFKEQAPLPKKEKLIN